MTKENINKEPNSNVELGFQISRTTATLLEFFRKELSKKTFAEPPLTISETIAFIIEDYTKSYYSDITGRGMR